MDDKEIQRVYGKVCDFLNSCNIFEVRNLARAFGVNKPTSQKKSELIMRIICMGAGISEPEPRSKKGARVKAGAASQERIDAVRKLIVECNAALNYGDAAVSPVEIRFGDSEPGKREYGYADACAAGLLEINKQGEGRLRGEGLRARANDVVVPEKMIRQYMLREGDFVSCYADPKDGYAEAVSVAAVNGGAPVFVERRHFNELSAVFPEERFELGRKDSLLLRAADLLCPVCKGQRGLLAAPAGTGKTTFFRELARSFALHYPQAKLILVFLDQRPEELTETKELFPQATVAAASFEDSAVNAARVAQLALETAKRTAERGGDAVLLLDSVTALARAVNHSIVPTGRATAGGVDLAALAAVKKYFASARKLKGAGSLTILASAVCGRGIQMDSVVMEELSGAANMTLSFSREIANRGVIPAIDFARSFTKRSEAILSEKERQCAAALRRAAEGGGGTERVFAALEKTENNEQFIAREELWPRAQSEE